MTKQAIRRMATKEDKPIKGDMYTVQFKNCGGITDTPERFLPHSKALFISHKTGIIYLRRHFGPAK